MSHHSNPRFVAEMVLPLLSLSLFFHSREPTNLRPHSGGILGINSPSIQGTSCFHIHCVCMCERERQEEREGNACFWTNLSLTMPPAVMQVFSLLFCFTSFLFQSLIHLSVCQIVRLREMLQPFYKTSIMSVSLSVFGKNVCSLSSPPLSQHVGLCVCEDSSCILRSRSRGKHLPLSPRSPSSSSSCPHLTLMAVGFLMRKWVSLCSMSVEGS